MSQIFAAISKVDQNSDGTIDVHGVASTESVDSQGEIVTKGAMQDAIPEFFKHGGTGPLRSMHQPIAAGYVYKAAVNDAGETEISAKVVDPVEVLKVTTGVYKGFSIGGKKLPGGYDLATKTISKMRLTEISLVDRPANPEAVITMWKGDDIGTTDDPVQPTATVAAVEKLAEFINKGVKTPESIVELIEVSILKADKAKKKPYGDVEYADKKNSKYPIDTEKHIRAAWSYINMPKNQKDYSDAEVKSIKAAIVAAWKKTIDKDGPPEKEDAEKFNAAEDIRKSMYGLNCFTQVIQAIADLATSAEYEAVYEGDSSPLPQQLRDWLATGIDLFKAMAEEETTELLASLQPKVSGDPVVIAMADPVGDLKKTLTGDTATVATFIKTASPYVSSLEISKALFDDQGVIGDNMSKLADVVVKAATTGAVDAIRKLADVELDLKKVSDERDALITKVKLLEALPAPAKAAVTTVEKGQDVVVGTTKTTDAIVKKADGSVDGEATAMNMIKQLHQSGGQRAAR